jgi:folate-dependent phosphoribosylglycinamide formyltransferase PurN
VSGKGSNLRNLVERGFNVVAVATNRPSCGGALFAREKGIPLGELSQKSFGSREDRDAAMVDFFRHHGVELVVDAGY